MKTAVDCVIIGGSYGGLSAALALGRSLRSVVVIDEGLPCNRFSPHSQNFLTHDGSVPGEIAALGRKQILTKYKTVAFVQDSAVSISKHDAVDGGDRDTSLSLGFDVAIGSGDIYECKRVVFAAGITDQFPGIPGFAECWGKSVIHCPYCHGYEYKGEPTGVLVTQGPKAMHLIPMVRNLTSNLKVFTNGNTLSDEEQANLVRNDIDVISTPVKEIHHDDNGTHVAFQDGSTVPIQVLYAPLPFELNAKSLLENAGCAIDSETGYVVVDGFQKTSVDGIYSCGDCTTRLRTVSNAVAGGNVAGMMINHELSMAEFAMRNK
ncbi:hypothetical protein ACA910_003030 [Epithemia clementina (nom. ined.)]